MSEKRFKTLTIIIEDDIGTVQTYIRSELSAPQLMDKIFELKEENEQLRQTMQKVCELLEEEVDLFSDEATEHDIIAYSEMQKFDNKDAYYMCVSTKKAIEKLKRWNE